MDYEVKFTWHSGFDLVFTAYQPSGVGRGIPDQPLPEVRDVGYYRATPLTDLVDGDVVQVHRLETVTWEDAVVVYLETEVPVLWELERVFSDEDWVADLDSTVNDTVTSKGQPVGSGEFTVSSGELSGIVDDVEAIKVAQQMIVVHVDDTEPAKEETVLRNL
jgi:hypothetical protein